MNHTTQAADDDGMALVLLQVSPTDDDEYVAKAGCQGDNPDTDAEDGAVKEVSKGGHAVCVGGAHPHVGHIAAVEECSKVAERQQQVRYLSQLSIVLIRKSHYNGKTWLMASISEFNSVK